MKTITAKNLVQYHSAEAVRIEALGKVWTGVRICKRNKQGPVELELSRVEGSIGDLQEYVAVIPAEVGVQVSELDAERFKERVPA